MSLALIAAAVWGFAEATLFFIVPDVLLSAFAIIDRRRAFIACATALAGALAGGALMYGLALEDAARAAHLVEQVPAISPELMARTLDASRSEGLIAMILGPLSGTPYKIFAVQAPELGVSFAQFLLASIPARLPRFVLVTLIASVAANLLKPRLGARVWAVWASVWIAFYALYFSVMPG